MKAIDAARTMLLLVLSWLALVSAAWGAGKARPVPSFGRNTPQPGPSLRVTAVIQPQMALQLDTDHIRFDVGGAPGEYDASQPVNVTVASNCTQWTVRARATDLTGTAGAALQQRARIPAARLSAASVRSDGTGASGFMPLDNDVVIAEGSQQGPSVVASVLLRLRTEWSDAPGEYEGQVNFTYIADF